MGSNFPVAQNPKSRRLAALFSPSALLLLLHRALPRLHGRCWINQTPRHYIQRDLPLSPRSRRARPVRPEVCRPFCGTSSPLVAGSSPTHIFLPLTCSPKPTLLFLSPPCHCPWTNASQTPPQEAGCVVDKPCSKTPGFYLMSSGFDTKWNTSNINTETPKSSSAENLPCTTGKVDCVRGTPVGFGERRHAEIYRTKS